MTVIYGMLLVDVTADGMGHPRCAMDEPGIENINHILSLQYFGDSIDRDLEVAREWGLQWGDVWNSQSRPTPPRPALP